MNESSKQAISRSTNQQESNVYLLILLTIFSTILSVIPGIRSSAALNASCKSCTTLD